ncbi:carbohydrate-binding protein [Marinobacter sp. F4206]|uniref:carbohydrate-binding protein n=1 Tax=Marinobacter sp. F4206 TaxID=2861777 RepID=UPI001C5DD746|nr:carbohydrate-binding protein [Marinobacter sp. F4206]MBW4934898.1 carbohydrate-binding protein [Marinobacter sp. F4206]
MFNRRFPHSLPSLLMLIIGLGLANVALAEPCDPEESGWELASLYRAGAVVFYDGQWFQARQISEGKEPGISFDWKELDGVPECDAEQKAKQDPVEETSNDQAGDTTTTGGSNPSICQTPEQWRFAWEYTEGNLVTHGGMVWEASRKTSGDMPGMNEPPRWREVEDHCSLKKKLDLETQ